MAQTQGPTRVEPIWTDRLERLVKALGSPEALAAKVGVSGKSVERWRAGRTPSRLARRSIEYLERQTFRGGAAVRPGRAVPGVATPVE